MPATNHDKIVVLDRDGVINQDSPDYIKSADEWLAIPRSIEAIAQLHQAGFLVVVATNQSGLARDYFDEFTLAQIHQKLAMTVEEAGGLISGIFYCPHGPDEACTCRKPGVGLLQQIEAELGIRLAGHCFVGDSLRDLQCGRDYSMQPVLVLSGNGNKTREQLAENGLGDIPVFPDLLDAVQQHILA